MLWSSKSAALAGVAAMLGVIYLVLASPSHSAVASALKLKTARTLSYDVELKFDNDKTRTMKLRTYVMVPGKLRQEIQTPQGQAVTVMDFVSGKSITLIDQQKLAIVNEIKNAPQMDLAKKEIDSLRSFADRNPRTLAAKEIDGVRVQGYELEADNQKTTLWADARTGDPVRIEIRWEQTPAGPISEVLTHLRLDEDLDSKLFDVSPPEGFKLMQLPAIDVSASPATHVAALLKLYAAQFAGAFPDRLQDAVKDLSAKLAPQDENALPRQEFLQIAGQGGVIGAMIMSGKQGELWQYYPGVRLGEKDQVVFWVFDRKTKEHTAVYGDLRIEPIEQDRLPAAK